MAVGRDLDVCGARGCRSPWGGGAGFIYFIVCRPVCPAEVHRGTRRARLTFGRARWPRECVRALRG